MKKLYTFLDNLLKLCSSHLQVSVCRSHVKIKIFDFIRVEIFIDMNGEDVSYKRKLQGLSDSYNRKKE